MTLSPKEMAKSISELKEAIKFLTLNTDRLLEANKMIMSLEQDVFHEKWKVRYLTRRIKEMNPDEPVTEEELDSVVADLVNKILNNGPLAVAAAKQLVFDVKDEPLGEELIEKTSLRIATTRVSAEGQEGLSAFLEKRTPAWRENS